MSEPVLTIDHLGVNFRTSDGGMVQAVADVSLDLYDREVLAIVGESGSGKSVSAMSVLGLLPPNAETSGSIRLGNMELLNADESVLSQVRGRRISMVFQDPFGALDPVFTVGFQLREMLKRHFPKMTRAERKERAVELLRTVDLPEPDKRVSSYPHQLSGGQAQRVVIAMALACDPEVLIADEPTTALDVTVQREILDVLMRLREEVGVAVLMITHDMGVVADVADRVVVMRHGRVEETQGVRSLFASPRAEYTRELLEAVPRLKAEPRPTVSAEDPVLKVERISVEYKRRLHTVTAVDSASLTVRPGEVTALVGESGSGKSTIGKAIIGLAPVRDGSIWVDGVDAVNSSGKELRKLRKRIGVVFQNPLGALDPRLTIGEATGEPLRVHRKLRGPALEAKVHELLDSVELPRAWAERFPHELSGGQRQRVSIARAVSLDPVLLIADEPTSALDVSVQATVLELFRKVQQELRFACLFVSHDLAVVDELADHVAVMHHGKIIEHGLRTDVLKNPQHGYTRRLLEAAPVPDPVQQRKHRLAHVAAK
ncbi:dipeptide ABC transporter ATP-binding protein [Nesterenkonia muleiensis]|uniref:dipeptide ABC transporter ATP-binding protein n=1 Tax=Nesterenkonia muleiensis TaxID=2282648 RepID=UPI000E70C5BC|nr:ABC transporter ATP-binding protein [Nesterenkonia muleiensis]